MLLYNKLLLVLSELRDKENPQSYYLSDLQSNQRGVSDDHSYSFVFSNKIEDWICQRVRQQQKQSKLRNGNNRNKPI